MTDDQSTENKPEQKAYRSYRVQAHGNSAAEIESDALAQARAYFGAGIDLEVMQNYSGAKNTAMNAPALYFAHVTVRALDKENKS